MKELRRSQGRVCLDAGHRCLDLSEALDKWWLPKGVVRSALVLRARFFAHRERWLSVGGTLAVAFKLPSCLRLPGASQKAQDLPGRIYVYITTFMIVITAKSIANDS